MATSSYEGILLVNKPCARTSFSLVHSLRKLCAIRTIGHAGTLDPFATGVMVMLIGSAYTKQSDQLLNQDKEYLATLYLGKTTDTFDCDGRTTSLSTLIPSFLEIEKALSQFQGTISQIPPMFCAKKVNGKKLCDLARQGRFVERKPSTVTVHIELIEYLYPHLNLRVSCSKGTYVRTLADDIGKFLGCGAHLCALCRTRSGSFTLSQCVDGMLLQPGFDFRSYLKKTL